MFTHTDSLCYESNEDFYKWFYEHKELFDPTNRPKNSIYFCDRNEKVLSKIEDAYGGNMIIEFIGLRSKMYSILDVEIITKRAQAKATMLL